MNVDQCRKNVGVEKKTSWFELLQLSPDDLVDRLENIRLAVQGASKIDK